ncbi:MAG TPA: peptidase S10 [Rhodanobacteraceae bacterium]
MRKLVLAAALTALVSVSPLSLAAHGKTGSTAAAAPASSLVKPQSSVTDGTVTVEGHAIHYKAVAGTLVLHKHGDQSGTPTLSMFYVAYFKKGAPAKDRPITFIYNGGPGSATVWLHMGAWGPRRVVTSDHTHTPAAPYGLVNNDYSLLDASDLVFIDAPGAGFSRLIANAKNPAERAKEMAARQKQFYSVDGDAEAFSQFIQQFLSKYGRWNSPKYLFGESYGTTRSAVLANILTNQDSIDLNGVILLSQILNFNFSIDGPKYNPGEDMPYIGALPTFAATAWYHHKLPNQPADLQAFLQKVEHYATHQYTLALMQGADLPQAQKQAVAEKLHEFTGLPVNYWLKANLRVSGGMFEHELLSQGDEDTGRLDTRFQGPALDPLGKSAQYDPQSSSISSAYVAVFNNYVRKTLHFGQGMHYRLYADINHWSMKHHGHSGTLNVMPDLAMAMKTDPNLKVMLNGGYYDLATPFFTAVYEMKHLPIPNSLQKNISYHWYQSGHMVYAHVPALKKLHDNVVRFIDQTENTGR